MARFDVETLLARVEAMLKSKLNTKIAAINLEKGDTTLLADIKDGAYYLQTLDAETVVHNPFIWYGIEDIQSIPIGGATGNNYTIGINLVLENAEESNPTVRLLRYLRALQECVEENWDTVYYGQHALIRGLPPQEIQNINTGSVYRAVRVQVEVCIG